MNERPSIKSILDHFSHAPYGWYQMGILCILARLFVRNKIELYSNGNLLEKKEVLVKLKSNRDYVNTLIEPTMNVDPKCLKDFYLEFFDETLAETELKPIAARLKTRMNDEVTTLNSWINMQSQYPFMVSLRESIQLMGDIRGKDPYWLIKNVNDFKGRLLDAKENWIDPIKRFMNSEQRNIYDNAIKFLSDENANLGYIDDASLETLTTLRDSREPYKHGQIRNAKTAIDDLHQFIHLKVAEERKNTLAVIDKTINKAIHLDDFQKIDNEKKEKLLKPFVEFKDIVERERYIPVIREISNRVENVLYPKMLQELNYLRSQESVADKVPVKEIVSIKFIKPAFYKPTLDDENDVNNYIESLKEKLLSEINNNRKISL